MTEISNELPEHILEDHVLEWLSIHWGSGGRVNPRKVQLKYSDIKNLGALKDEKHIARSLPYSISPHMISALPPLRKEKLKNKLDLTTKPTLTYSTQCKFRALKEHRRTCSIT